MAKDIPACNSSLPRAVAQSIIGGEADRQYIQTLKDDAHSRFAPAFVGSHSQSESWRRSKGSAPFICCTRSCTISTTRLESGMKVNILKFRSAASWTDWYA